MIRSTLRPIQHIRAVSTNAARTLGVGSRPIASMSTGPVDQQRSSSTAYLHFEDTGSLYQLKSTAQLTRSYLFLRLMQNRFVGRFGPWGLRLAESTGLSGPLNFLLKHTVFRRFCAGETLPEAVKTCQSLSSTIGVGSILDYAVEAGKGSINEDNFEESTQHIVDAVEVAGEVGAAQREAAKSGLRFTTADHINVRTQCMASLKVTGFGRPELLERLSNVLCYYHTNPEQLTTANNPHANLFNMFSGGAAAYRSFIIPADFQVVENRDRREPPPALSESEFAETQRMLDRLHRMCNAASEKQVKLLIDAEQSFYQPAIDFFTVGLCSEYNRDRPIVHNTYQMYLKNAFDRLQRDSRRAQSEGWQLGAKVVRGAYLTTETVRARDRDYPCPLHDCIEDTHLSYNSGVKFVLGQHEKTGVVIATHNPYTVKLSYYELMTQGIPLSHPNVVFAHLHGMCEYLPLALASSGCNVAIYLPFGPVAEVLPYLTRRLEENSGIFGAAKRELDLITNELARRRQVSKGVVNTRQ